MSQLNYNKGRCAQFNCDKFKQDDRSVVRVMGGLARGLKLETVSNFVLFDAAQSEETEAEHNVKRPSRRGLDREPAAEDARPLWRMSLKLNARLKRQFSFVVLSVEPPCRVVLVGLGHKALWRERTAEG